MKELLEYSRGNNRSHQEGVGTLKSLINLKWTVAAEVVIRLSLT